MTDKLDLSIIIPTYNRLALLQEALASFVGKLACSYEVIIVDDGSTDGTREFLQGLGEPYRVFLAEHRGGSAARNTGMKAARGGFIKFLDDDDLLNANVVDAQVNYLRQYPNIDLVYSEFTEWIADGVRQETPSQRGRVDDLLDAHLTHWWCANFSYLFRAKSLTGIVWDENLRTLQDADFILRVAVTEPNIAYLHDSIGRYRRHSQTTVSHMDPLLRKNIWVRLWKNTLTALQTKGTLTTQRRHLLAERFYELAEQLLPFDRKLAQKNLVCALDLDPAYVPERPRYRQLVRVFGHWRAMQVKHIILHKVLGKPV